MISNSFSIVAKKKLSSLGLFCYLLLLFSSIIVIIYIRAPFLKIDY